MSIGTFLAGMYDYIIWGKVLKMELLVKGNVYLKF
jgi:hypothetical protein